MENGSLEFVVCKYAKFFAELGDRTADRAVSCTPVMEYNTSWITEVECPASTAQSWLAAWDTVSSGLLSFPLDEMEKWAH